MTSISRGHFLAAILFSAVAGGGIGVIATRSLAGSSNAIVTETSPKTMPTAGRGEEKNQQREVIHFVPTTAATETALGAEQPTGEIDADSLRERLGEMRAEEFRTAMPTNDGVARAARLKAKLEAVLNEDAAIDELSCKSSICRVTISRALSGPANSYQWAMALGDELPHVDFTEIRKVGEGQQYTIYASNEPSALVRN